MQPVFTYYSHLSGKARAAFRLGVADGFSLRVNDCDCSAVPAWYVSGYRVGRSVRANGGNLVELLLHLENYQDGIMSGDPSEIITPID
jgi:hypothetical protein